MDIASLCLKTRIAWPQNVLAAVESYLKVLLVNKFEGIENAILPLCIVYASIVLRLMTEISNDVLGVCIFSHLNVMSLGFAPKEVLKFVTALKAAVERFTVINHLLTFLYHDHLPINVCWLYLSISL